MDTTRILQIFRDTAYVRTGGSVQEKKTAGYLGEICRSFGLSARIESFDVPMSTIREAVLTVDGKEIPCKGYLCAGTSEVEAPLYYLTDADPFSLSQIRGKIVLSDGYLGFWRYHDLVENGAVGFITYDGNAFYADRDIDQRELRSYVSEGKAILPGVNINIRDAAAMIERGAARAKITLRQDEYTGQSQNVVLDLPGETEQTIVLTAHYDSTSLSQGAYDNMSGSVGLLAMAEHFAKHPHRFGLRFIWCGSEERGLLGSKAYCAANEEALKDIVLCVNLDMIGCTMGKFIACCTSEMQLVHYISYMGRELGFQTAPYQDVYSSDSTPFSDKGIPSVSFARVSPREAAPIHNRYDTLASIKAEHMEKDIDFITQFVFRMANAKFCPVEKMIPDNMKEKLDKYLCRKR
ncbi:MAG: Zn-dependent exopeptidase M28 [Clostridia bacterium]|nr:Zn-dependent exopeptidase M28 [Clostridia bacterium]